MKPLPLTEQQWAKINGERAGREGYSRRYNPYFDDVELHTIWERARATKFALHHNNYPESRFV
jgi:hypothetical protein